MRIGQSRLDWIETAISPVRDRLTKPSYDRLVAALAVSLGVDALIVLRDICGLEADQIQSVMVWTAHSLLDAALASSKTTESSDHALKNSGG